ILLFNKKSGVSNYVDTPDQFIQKLKILLEMNPSNFRPFITICITIKTLKKSNLLIMQTDQSWMKLKKTLQFVKLEGKPYHLFVFVIYLYLLFLQYFQCQVKDDFFTYFIERFVNFCWFRLKVQLSKLCSD